MKRKYAVIRLDKFPLPGIDPNHFKIISMFPEYFDHRNDAELFIQGIKEDVVSSVIEVFVKE